MRPGRRSGAEPTQAEVDALHGAVRAAGSDVRRIRELLCGGSVAAITLIAVLRRSVPVRFLELLVATSPWSEDARILGAVAANPRTPASVALRVLPYLFWRDLAEVAGNNWVVAAVRSRAEGVLQDMLPDLRLGERMTLARLATRPLLGLLLGDGDARVVRLALQNPRLREEDLLAGLRRDRVSRTLIEEAADAYRWRSAYAVRVAIVLQPRTPLAVGLAQLSALLPADLGRVAAAAGLPRLVQVAAERLAAAPRGEPEN